MLTKLENFGNNISIPMTQTNAKDIDYLISDERSTYLTIHYSTSHKIMRKEDLLMKRYSKNQTQINIVAASIGDRESP